MGARPGGLVGVRRASVGIGGGGPGGGGVSAGPAKGLVIYDASDVIDGIGSRRPDPPARRLLSPARFPFLGELPGEERARLSLGFTVRVLDGVESLPPRRGLTELTGGWLWNRQNT